MLSYVAEDMGGQNDLMISPAHVREFLLPGMKRIIDLAHARESMYSTKRRQMSGRIVPGLRPSEIRATGAAQKPGCGSRSSPMFSDSVITLVEQEAAAYGAPFQSIWTTRGRRERCRRRRHRPGKIKTAKTTIEPDKKNSAPL